MNTSPAGRSVSQFGRARRRLLVPVILLGCAAAIAAYQAPASVDPPKTRELKVLHLSGSAYERGLQHGT